MKTLINIYFWRKIPTFCSRSPSARYYQSFICSPNTCLTQALNENIYSFLRGIIDTHSTRYSSLLMSLFFKSIFLLVD